MNEPVVAIQIPMPLYHRLQRLSELTQRSLERLVVQTLESHTPTLPENLPEDVRAELISLEKLDDDMLWQVAQCKITPAQQKNYRRLLEKKRQGNITAPEQKQLDKHYQEGNQLTLRKAYAAVLLKWRGYRLPTLAELEARR